jgi:hypothetical protein
MRQSLILVFIMCTLMLAAQNETESNKKISTSWGYNIHLYKGMFDFKPPVVDINSDYYPWFYMTYVNFKYSSDVRFNVDYRLFNQFYISAGISLYAMPQSAKANHDFIVTLTAIDVGNFIEKYYNIRNVVFIPAGLKYKYKNISFAVGMVFPVLNANYSVYRYSNNILEKKMSYFGYINDFPFSTGTFLSVTFENIITLNNCTMGLQIGYNNNVYIFQPYRNLSFGFKFSHLK